MAALKQSIGVVNDYWMLKHGAIDMANLDYLTLREWATTKAFNGRKPITIEMLNKHLGVTSSAAGAAAAAGAGESSQPKPKPTPKSTPKSAGTTTGITPKSNLKQSLMFMYPLFGKKDGRGNIKSEDAELYDSMRSWITEQVGLKYLTHVIYLTYLSPNI